ncbi:MAG: class I SAM-dependent methyltransferase [Omnitrophica bacterium]|nr:class I SAM-dependent methyltransferase [Candidatus Omnitrophota bacterium]
MKRETNWHERYMTGDIPWDTGRYDFNLSKIVTRRPIQPCKTLEVGCGTGSNAIWLSRQGFSVTAVDVSEIAVQRAIKKSSKARLACNFFVANFMKQKISSAPFGFVFDRGCFHSFDSPKERSKYVKIVNSYLKRRGLWLTLVGSADEPPRNPGPPQRTARDITTAVEPYFNILSLYASHFDSNMQKPPKAWVCLMQKRK